MKMMDKIQLWYAGKLGKTPQEFDEFDTQVSKVIAVWELERNGVIGQNYEKNDSNLLLDFVEWRRQVAVADLKDQEIVEFYLSRRVKQNQNPDND
jgi:hypothetical protein